jgi:thiol-disulfide isomerase/thioredoxin
MSLADFRGRVLLLNFWASWCSTCLTEMPALEQLQRAYARAGLAVLGVNLQEDEEIVESYRTKLKLSFPLALDPDGAITRAYGVIGVPSTYLIGRDGRPVALAVGDREWDSAPARRVIEALLAEPANPRDAR